jgi:acetyl esterase/lipase
VEDCYAALVWAADQADDLGVDVDRLVVAGVSAGGGIAAGVALLARDRGGPRLHAQMLMCPMLDDRDSTVSTSPFDGIGTWDRGSNRMAWTALLGNRRGTPDVSVYAAPARATDLSGLPATLIDCGSADLFRDEDVAYASGIWAAGGRAELHIWPGGYHAFDLSARHTRLAEIVWTTRSNWLERVLARERSGE